MPKKFNIGFVKHKGGGEYFSSCNCGNINQLGSLNWRELERMDVTCPSCKNTNFINLSSKNRDIFPYMEVLEKSRKGFKLKRTNLSVFYDEDFKVLTKENMIQVLKLDLVKNEIKLYKNGETFEYSKFYMEENIGRFFRSANDYKIIKMVSTAETESLYDFIWHKLAYKRNGWGERKFHKGIVNYVKGNYGYMQVLSNAGFPNITRFYETSSYYSENVINRQGTNPKDIIGLPKFLLKYLRENQNVGTFEIKQIKNALKKVDGNRFRELMEIVKDESSVSELCRALDNLIEIHDTYGYNNIKKLTLYLFREVRMNQGITSPQSSAGLLRDYIRMATKLGVEFEKYPKSLKKEHDILQMNYRVQEDAIKKKEFAEVVEKDDYKEFEYECKTFSIVSPKEMDDLVKEGSELSHCVASYVTDIVSKRCKIFFLRKTKNIDMPFATVETRGNNVRQARGYANRTLTQEERDFLAEWAEKKNLQLNYY